LQAPPSSCAPPCPRQSRPRSCVAALRPATVHL
jgi:hypothetical protein